MPVRIESFPTSSPASFPTSRPAQRLRRHGARQMSRLLSGLLSSLFASLVAAQLLPPTALPQGGQVMVGSGRISQTVTPSGSQMLINQTSARLGLDWQSFDIGSRASVEFKQPDANSIALNRVLGNESSSIYGRLSANGQVFLTNPNGVLFAPGAKVDVGGLVASTLDLSQRDFAAGDYRFRSGGGTAQVLNQGRLSAADGGYLALLGNRVANDGEMTVKLGSVLLASGHAATVNIGGSGLLSAVVAPGLAGSVDNRGLIAADGGTVTLSARSAEAIASSLVNNSGVIRANAMVERGGEIWITGDRVVTSGQLAADAAGSMAAGRIVVKGDLERGSAEISGSLSARSEHGAGGNIETSAARVRVADGTRVDTRGAAGREGTWLIDPTNFSIDSGGGASTSSGIGADTLSANLASGNITLATSLGVGSDPGDLNVNAAVSWSANTRLTLQAFHDINVNADITASGNTAGLVLTPNVTAGVGGGVFRINNTTGVRPKITLSGSSPTLQIAGIDYTLVKDLTGLQAIDGTGTALSGNYALAVDIDASATATSDSGQGFNPIGDEISGAASFSGRFDGLGHTISGLNINRPGSNYTGLFAVTDNASVQNLSLSAAVVAGSNYVGGAVGYAQGSTRLQNIVSDITLAGVDDSSSGVFAGAIAGRFTGSGGASLTASSATGRVYGESNTSHFIGGMVGYADSASLANLSSSVIVTANDRGSGTGSSYTGGVVGYFGGSLIDHASASGNVAGLYYTGGVVGYANMVGGDILSSQATGKVSGTSYVGGLAGVVYNGAVAGSSATGAVTALSKSSSVFAGGLIGQFGYYYSDPQAVTSSSASGTVFADGSNTYTGGLVGYMNGGAIASSSSSSNVTGIDGAHPGVLYSSHFTGGLAGYWYSASGISNSSASGNVRSAYYGGGLVGYFAGGGSITNSSASGQVDALYSAGGLAGVISAVTITNSSASGQVTGRNGGYVGGLVGQANTSLPMSNVSATGDVNGIGGGYVGGLIGYLYGNGLSAGFAGGQVSADGGSSGVGGLIGLAQPGYANARISDSVATGNVSGGSYYLGGLIGYYYNASSQGGIETSRASGNVGVSGNPTYYTGGLVGYFSGYGGSASTFDIRDSSASGNVYGGGSTGGLVGYYSGSSGISRSFATGNVAMVDTNNFSQHYVGGLVGYYANGASAVRGGVSGSYATGNVSSVVAGTYGYYDSNVGGLIGQLNGFSSGISLSNSYASGAVSSTRSGIYANSYRNYAGGLVGQAATGIDLTYASGAVSVVNGRAPFAGGLVGNTSRPVARSYWDTGSSGLSASAGGIGLTTAQMMLAASFSGWDIANTPGAGTTWRSYDGLTRPLLGNFLTPLALTLADASKVYDGGNSFGNAALLSGGVPVGHPERIFVAGMSPNVGSTSVAAANVYSVQNGYDLSVSGSSTLTVNARTLSLAGVIADKVYDGNRDASLVAGAQPVGLVAGEDLSFNTAGFAAAFADKNAGLNKTVSITGLALADGTLGKASNYSLGGASSTTASIAKAPLTVGSLAATNRAYDGSTNVTIVATPATLAGKVAGDDVSADISGVTGGSIADKNVGTARPVVVVAGATLTGTDAGNYRIAGLDGVTVDISPRALVANSLTASNRAYDHTVNVSVYTGTGVLNGALSGDNVALASQYVTGQMVDKDVGTAKPVTVNGLTLRGPDSANYSVSSGPVAIDITPYLTYVYVYDAGHATRTYDGSNSASLGVYFSYYGGDAVTLSTDAPTYTDKNVAYDGSGSVTYKTINVTGGALSGSDAKNYSLVGSSTSYAYGRILPKALAVTGVTAADRAYDGSINVAVNVGTASIDSSGVVGGDSVSISVPGSGLVTGTIANKTAGSNKAVTVPGLGLTGGDALNYTLTGSGGITVNIARKDVTATYTGVDRTYNGNVYVNVLGSTSDFVSGDSVDFVSNLQSDQSARYYAGTLICYYICSTFSGTGAKNVGSDKAVRISGDYIYGSDSGNYNLVNRGIGTATANVSAKSITPVLTGANKVYDGTTDANANLNFGASGIYGGDSVGSTQTALFTGTGAKNVGTGKAIAISGIALTGSDATNYSLSSTTASTSANITRKAVTVTGITATDRVYDGTVNVAVSGSSVGSSGFVSGDDIHVDLPGGGLSTGTMADKSVGSSKPVTVTGLSLAGTDAGNYLIDSTTSGIVVNIDQRPLTATYTGVNRVYTGGITAPVLGASADIVSGDSVGLTQSAVFSGVDGRNAGTHKTINVTGIGLTGSDSANYALQNGSAITFADITPKPITVGYVGLNRVYNGLTDTSVSVTGSSPDVIGIDSVTFSQSAAFHGDGAAGTAKPIDIINITLGGLQSSNYTLTGTTASTSANITRRPIGVTGISATDRVYDGSATVAINVSGASVDRSAVVGADNVVVTLPSSGISTGTALDSAGNPDKNVGSGKPVQVTGLGISGSEAANYMLTGAAGLNVNITPLAVTAVYGGNAKVYDGSVLASVSASSGDFATADIGAVGIHASGRFIDGKAVGDNKRVDVSDGFLTGVERNNYSLANPSGSTTASITPKSLTPSYSGINRIYDGSALAGVNSTTAGVVSGDVVNFTQDAAFTGAGAKNVGSGKAIAVNHVAIDGADAGNYTLSSTLASTFGNITAKGITVSGLSSVSAADRVYDGSRTVVVTVPSSVTLVANSADIVSGDDVTIAVPASGTTTGTVADKNVGAHKAVVVSGLGLSGVDAGNYFVVGTAGVSASITPLSLTASYSGVNKAYDGGTSAAVVGSSTDILGGDSVTINGSGVFTGVGAKNVGSAKSVSFSGIGLAGLDAGNYSLSNSFGTTTADISRKTLAPSYAGGTRVYDGTTAAPVTSTTGGVIDGDSVAFSQSADFAGANKNVGDNKPVNVSAITLSGSDAGNYRLSSSSTTTTASVTRRPITLIGLDGVTAVNRVYDHTTSVDVLVSTTGTPTPSAGDLIAGDDIVVNVPSSGTTTGTMADRFVGIGKPLLSITGLGLSGTAAGNYSLSSGSGVTVDITPKSVGATWTGINKVYDGLTTATVSGSSTDVFSGDVVSFSGLGVYTGVNAKNVGTAKPIDVRSGTLSGSDAANYALSGATGTTTADITRRPVSVSYSGTSRIYDGGISAPVSGTASALVTGDDVGLTQTAAFTGSGARNVGNNKPVAVTDIALTGSDAPNYLLTDSASATTASVTPKSVTVLGLTGVSASDRVYNGLVTVDVNVATTGGASLNPADIVTGDRVGIDVPSSGLTTGRMADKNVGSRKSVVVAGLALTGDDSANYMISGVDGVTVNITPKSLTANYFGVNRVYDGTALASVSGASGDVIGLDSVSILASGLFSGSGAKNVGLAKAIDVSAGTLGGLDARNYLLSNPTGSASADVTPRPVSASYTGGSREYDRSVTAPVTAELSGGLRGDVLTLGQTAVFSGADAKNVGTGKPVLVSDIVLGGADADNYALSSHSASTTASVTAKPITLAGVTGVRAVDRVYNGSPTVDVVVGGSGATPTSSDIIAGDDVNIAGDISGRTTGTMADKNVGSNKPVVVSGFSLSGTDAVNYVITGIGGVSVNISPLAIRVAGLVPIDRTYNGDTAVAINSASASLGGAVLSGDDVRAATSGVTGSMADKNAATNKPVLLSGLALTGVDAGNYIASTDALTVSIAPRTLTVVANAVGKTYDGNTAAPSSLRDDRLAGDVFSVTSLSADFADPHAGIGKAVTLSGLSLSGSDATNYALASTRLSGIGDIQPARLDVTGASLSKVYGNSLSIAGTEFLTLGLVAGETAGLASLTSDGSAVTAAARPYELKVSNLTGGSFDPTNYDLRYNPGVLTVTPRSLIVAADSAARYADVANATLSFGSSVFGLVNGDKFGSAIVSAPDNSERAPGGSVFDLTPSGGVFGRDTLAANYALVYKSGLLIVLPTPPRLDDPVADSQQQDTGKKVFFVSLTPEEVQSTVNELTTASAVTLLSTAQGGPPTAKSKRQTDSAVDLAAAAAASKDEAAPITLPGLQRTPLITFDAALRRLISGGQ